MSPDYNQTKITTPIVHLMFNEKFNKPFVDFINKNFDNNEHLILCKRWYNEIAKPFPDGKNVIEIKSLKHFDFTSSKIKKIICHSLFDNELINLLYEQPELLKKAYWVIWGGDLYEAFRDKKNDFVRQNFKGYLTVATKDKNVTIEKYHPNNDNFHNIQYIIPTKLEYLNKAKQNKSNNDCVKIQINNCCEGITLEALDILSKFKDENIKITTILSCGEMELKDEIIQKGKEIFGEKFEYVDKMISPEEYSNHLSTIDIFVLNQNRQQALGNIFAGLYFGAKIFIKSNISSYSMLKDNFDIYDTYSIKDLTFEEFIQNPHKDKNAEQAALFFDEKRIKSLWERVFND